MKILVTGSAGKLGKEIVKQLRLQGYEAIGVDLLASDTTDEFLDIRNKDQVEEITKGVDGIMHTAALHGKHYELNYPRKDFINTNIHGTLNLLRACVKNAVPKLIYTSTTSIYGTAMVNPKQAVWVDEELIPEPRDIYDITKLTCELLCKDYFEKEGLETTVLRVSRFLPEEMNTKAIHRLYRGLDEEDGAIAHILAFEKKFKNFQRYNISNESPFQQEDLAKLYTNPREVIVKYYKEVEEIFHKKGWNFPDKIDRVYSIEKAKRDLNYKPSKNFDSFL